MAEDIRHTREHESLMAEHHLHLDVELVEQCRPGNSSAARTAPRGLSSYCSLTRECGFVAFDVAVPVRLQDHLARDLRPDSNSISRLLNTWSKEDAESF
jgi:hypothetical protein